MAATLVKSPAAALKEGCHVVGYHSCHVEESPEVAARMGCHMAGNQLGPAIELESMVARE